MVHNRGSEIRNPQSKLIPVSEAPVINLAVDEEEAIELRHRANSLAWIDLSPRSLCDLELLASGALSPLERFMGKADYENVLKHMTLANGTLFPLPITLPFSRDQEVSPGQEVALRTPRHDIVAILSVEEVFDWHWAYEAETVYGTTDARHPMIAEMCSLGNRCASGPLRLLKLPKRYDFAELRKTPSQVRHELEGLGNRHVIAFQPIGPMYRPQEEFLKSVAADLQASVLVQTVVGLARPGDIDCYTSVRSYKVLLDKYFDDCPAVLALLPFLSRYAGPREALLSAVMLKNFGATHFIVSHDYAASMCGTSGKPFYDVQAAQDLIAANQIRSGITMVPMRELVFLPAKKRYVQRQNVPVGTTVLTLSAAELNANYLSSGRTLPEWFIRPEVAAILSRVSPPLHRSGFCVWFTGLSGAGKSTLAEVLVHQLMEHGRQVTLLDGDVVRTHLSKGLTFSKEDRDMNIRRIGFVASEIVRHHGSVICAAVSPYRVTRNEVRNMVVCDRFVEVFVDTPLDVCEQRDTKGMYAKARRGEIKGFTGINDPYEAPVDPEIRITTTNTTLEASAEAILAYLRTRGFLLKHDDCRNFDLLT